MAASVASINGHALSGAVSQTGNNTQAEQNLYYFFPPMAAGFTATGTVSLTYGSLPAGARVQFLARAGTIACSGGNAAPTVSITSPAANATFTAPASITLTANAQDTDGTVTQVQYFANASPIGTATASPYSFNWTNVAAGSYSLTAAATDNAGASTTSAPVAITVGAAQAKLYFIHTDHLNTPRLIADDQQRTVWRWDNTDPFGGNPPDENPSGLGAFEFPLRLPGQYYDKETNLHYNYFRDYDPSLGRYGESDPIGLRGGPNTYAYVYGDPLRFSDPKGLDTYICTRPLRGSGGLTPGPAFHQYVCTWNDYTGQIVCGSITPTGSMFGSPSRLTGPNDDDVYDPTRCRLVAPPNDCLETCIADRLRGDLPEYDVRVNVGRGRPGAQECQTFSNNVLSSCRQQCGLQ
jgi:RHS repeat-associated protein